jgi:GxxExxY protein
MHASNTMGERMLRMERMKEPGGAQPIAPRREDSTIGWQALGAQSAMPRIELIEKALSHSVIGAFFEVYNTLGFGFLEHVYVMALERELIARGHRVAREVYVSVYYKGHELADQRIDMLVDDKLIVEVKATYLLPRIAPRQVYNYLKATKLEVGLLLHFGPSPMFYRLISRNMCA